MNRRIVLAGLIAAPAVIRTAGLLMPVRHLSAEERDPTDINGIIAELPDGATWRPMPGRRFYARDGLVIQGKRDLLIDLTESHVSIGPTSLCAIRIRDCHGVTLGKGAILQEGYPGFAMMYGQDFPPLSAQTPSP